MAASAPLWQLQWISPAEVRFTQAACNPEFKNGAGTLPELYFSIVSGRIGLGDVRPIRCYWHEGRWYSVDNRRLAVWRVLHLSGHVRHVPVLQTRMAPGPSFFGKLSTRCEGEFILIRGVNLFVGIRGMFFMPGRNSREIVFAC